MALSGLEIYKLLPKTNCKECGFPTCLAFAMQLAAKKVTLDKCIKISDESKGALEGASQPPIKLATIGSGENKLEVGNETVLFRHEETFYHPAGVGFLLEDTLGDKEFKAAADKINKLTFHRVGQIITVNLIALKNSSSDPAKFAEKAKLLASATKLNIILVSENAQAQVKALEQLKDKRPLIYAATKKNYEEFAKLAKQYNAPLAVRADSLDELAELTLKLKSMGADELVLDSGEKNMISKITDLVNIRRLALKKILRALGYPVMVFSQEKDPFKEAFAAVSYICRYASIVVLNNHENWQVLPILTARQDIYTDPQKPVQVEAKIYEIGNVKKDSPVIVTTNFSITYYTVAGEVEASKIPSYIIACDCEGMSVLTAWAAEKFTPEKIVDTIKKFGIAERVSHKSIIIPGYVAMMSGKLEDLLPGYKVIVGPREASGIPSFLKSLTI